MALLENKLSIAYSMPNKIKPVMTTRFLPIRSANVPPTIAKMPEIAKVIIPARDAKSPSTTSVIGDSVKFTSENIIHGTKYRIRSRRPRIRLYFSEGFGVLGSYFALVSAIKKMRPRVLHKVSNPDPTKGAVVSPSVSI